MSQPKTILKSRILGIKDEDWTKAVFDRLKKTSYDLLETLDDPIKYIEDILEKELLYKTSLDVQSIDLTWGEDWNTSAPGWPDRKTGLLQAEIILIREMYQKGEMTVPELAYEFRTTEENIETVLDGKTAPYVGGALRMPALQGVNPDTAAYTANQRKFTRGILRVAKENLTPKLFEIFANFNGMAANRASEVVSQVEEANEQIAQRRYRRVLMLCAKGKGLEEAIKSDGRRTSGNKPGRPRKGK